MLSAPCDCCRSLAEKRVVLVLAVRSSLGPHTEWYSCVNRNAGPTAGHSVRRSACRHPGTPEP